MLTCGIADQGVSSDRAGHYSSEEDLLVQWHRPGFTLEEDAVIILTTTRQLAGYTDVCHSAYNLAAMRLYVHPQYRHRGIGTLLLRITEQRARDYARKADSVVCFTLQSEVNANNHVARDLLEREGFQLARSFSRLMLDAADSVDGIGNPIVHPMRMLEVPSLIQLPSSPRRTGIYTARLYCLYEKVMYLSDNLRLQIEKVAVSDH